MDDSGAISSGGGEWRNKNVSNQGYPKKKKKEKRKKLDVGAGMVR
jgi:hypothetical protein